MFLYVTIKLVIESVNILNLFTFSQKFFN